VERCQPSGFLVRYIFCPRLIRGRGWVQAMSPRGSPSQPAALQPSTTNADTRTKHTSETQNRNGATRETASAARARARQARADHGPLASMSKRQRSLRRERRAHAATRTDPNAGNAPALPTPCTTTKTCTFRLTPKTWELMLLHKLVHKWSREMKVGYARVSTTEQDLS